jgi:cytochrome c2
VYVALALLGVFAVVFVIELASLQPAAEEQIELVSAQSYRAQVDALLAQGAADSSRAEAVILKYGCDACHRIGAENGIAPSWVGIAERATTRRPPMPADAYIYESIIHPSAYVVEGYPDSMLKNFRTRISDQELSDLIAYLLTPDAH